MKTLVIDPRARLGGSIAKTLEEQFLPAFWEPDPIAAERRALGGEYQVIVLTHDPPLVDGLAALARLREKGVARPIVLLSRTADPAFVAKAFAAGADDVVKRPFAIDEFVARVRRYILRSVAPEHQVLECGELKLDLTAKRTYVGKQELRLTPRETMLLQVFLLHRGQVLSRSQIISKVWGSVEVPFANVVDVQVLRLRRALGKIGRELIQTVHGFGYRLGE